MNFRNWILQNFPLLEDDFDALTDYELFTKMCSYVLEYSKDNEEMKAKITEFQTYFDNLDVQEEVNNKLDEMAQSGELTELITYYLELPNGNYIDAQRIGRKLVYGTNPNSSNYIETGLANGMQGGCVIDENRVAYMLWDNLNQNLNKNKLVLMNIITGEILNEADFNYGWCNSIAYSNNLLYIAVRGTTVDGVATNNGDIKVIDIDTLSLVNEFTLPINVNAISIYNDTLYALQENTNSIYTYNLDGTTKSEIISLINNITLYNQDIKVTDNYIYLVSTLPSNIINVYMKNGTHIKSYNLPKYGGLYKIGELQWLDILKDNDMVLGSNITNYEESINQFFKINFVENVSTNNFLEDYVETLYVNSDTNNYNPNGTLGNEFKTINECDILNIDNMFLRCNNKNYKYTHLHNKKSCLIYQAVFDEGLYIQNGTYNIVNSTINYSINESLTACLFVRDSILYSDNTSYNANSNNYCINSDRYNIIKFITPTFLNYNTSVFTNSAPNSIIEVNNLNNTPYLPRTYGKHYNLMNNGYINQYKPGSYNFNTNLSESQIEELFNNSQYIIVGYNPLNHGDIREIVINKNNAGNYTIVDSSTSSGSVNLRVSKMIATINKNGITITSNTTTSVLPDSTSVTNASDSNTAELFIQIRYIKLMLDY